MWDNIRLCFFAGSLWAMLFHVTARIIMYPHTMGEDFAAFIVGGGLSALFITIRNLYKS